MATNPYVNKVSYNGRTLIDISDTTATADKVQNGYKFYTADGTATYGTAAAPQGVVVTDTTDAGAGGTIRTITSQVIQAYTPYGGNARKVWSYQIPDIKLSGTTYNDYISTTGAKQIKAAANIGTYVFNWANQDYFTKLSFKIKYRYLEGITLKAVPYSYAAVFGYVHGHFYSSRTNVLNNNNNYLSFFNMTSRLFLEYYNTSGTLTQTTSNYGVYPNSLSFSYSPSSRTVSPCTVTLNAPAIYVNNNASYSAITRTPYIDQENTVIQMVYEVYELDLNTNYGTWAYREAADMIRSMEP